MSVELVISAVLWAVFATVVSQMVAILLMWALGLPPKKLTREIEDVQNPAVGAIFFIISLGAAIFVSLMSSEGFTPDPDALESTLWIVGGLLVASVFTLISWVIAYYIMEPLKGENLYQYLRRELIQEQNAALAFFLGGLAIVPFIAVTFQLI